MIDVTEQVSAGPGSPMAYPRKEKGETAHIPPLSIYSAPGGLRQDPGRAAE
jgi:hypothetical protein